MAMIVLALLALTASIAFMTLGARGNWSFIIPFRGAKLLGLVLVAYSIAVSTVLFQTITGNRILTPSIMGFDSLYILIQTVLVFFVGASRISAANPHILFALEVSVLVVFAGLLYRWLVSGAVRSLHLLMLVGIIFGILFRSTASFLQRVIDPSEFLVLQDRLFASFNSIDSTLLGLSVVMVMAVSLAVMRMLPVFDVLALGRENAIVLGVEHRRVVTLGLGMITLLVAVSTALVGPVTFFGLLVANLAYLLLPASRHAILLPAAALIAIALLVGGQVVLERVFGLDAALSMIIEFIGGIFFILLVVRGAAR
ncbi:iron complex transport system permease protein [Mesorhizobium sp. J18]|uniref:iron chelate uptake ABC transporter family permease subunit n=1 Tax=Mesorhizobium sp. J18 TaxID=935263 RepID=UPI0011991380|nr:iron chelate uptake ABC transporter family permease subunit [Mesorhizobium sp. J18]TWG92363.1 iron complex transport system permease protein [Mesorhizobium sp. J18]